MPVSIFKRDAMSTAGCASHAATAPMDILRNFCLYRLLSSSVSVAVNDCEPPIAHKKAVNVLPYKTPQRRCVYIIFENYGVMFSDGP